MMNTGSGNQELTDRQLKVLRAVAASIARRGFAPTVRELCEELGAAMAAKTRPRVYGAAGTSGVYFVVTSAWHHGASPPVGDKAGIG